MTSRCYCHEDNTDHQRLLRQETYMHVCLLSLHIYSYKIYDVYTQLDIMEVVFYFVIFFDPQSCFVFPSHLPVSPCKELSAHAH